MSPPGAIKPTGTWGLATRAGDFIFVAGMRGIDPRTDMLVAGDEARVRQAFLKMKLIAELEGVTVKDAVRLVGRLRYRHVSLSSPRQQGAARTQGAGSVCTS